MRITIFISLCLFVFGSRAQDTTQFEFPDSLVQKNGSHSQYTFYAFPRGADQVIDDSIGFILKPVPPTFKKVERWLVISELKQERDTFFELTIKEKATYYKLSQDFNVVKDPRVLALPSIYFNRKTLGDTKLFYTGDFDQDTFFYTYDSLIKDGYVSQINVVNKPPVHNDEAFYLVQGYHKFKTQYEGAFCTMGSSKLKAQMKLKMLGYETTLSGHMDETTTKGLTAFQKKHGLPPGPLDVPTLNLLSEEVELQRR